MQVDDKRDFNGLKALFLNCTLKKSPEVSNTEGLVGISRTIMEKNGVSVEVAISRDAAVIFK